MQANLLNLIDPELRDIAVQMEPMLAQFSPMTAEKLETWRSLMESNASPPLENIDVQRRIIPSSAGAPDVPVYVVNAKPGQSRPGILHLHGGGFTAGSAGASLRNVQQIAETLNCVAVSVDYRLAPEAPWPASLEDNYAALCWVCDHAGEIGIDPSRIAVIGESAGAGHAVLLCAAARKRAGPAILFQALSYPMLDDRTGSTRLAPDHIGVIGWNADFNQFGWRSYLGREPGGDDVPEGAVPARLVDLTGMPPTFIGVGALDLFVEEDIEFARRLVVTGVPVEFLLVPGAFHGFDTVAPETVIARKFADARIAALRRAFAEADRR